MSKIKSFKGISVPKLQTTEFDENTTDVKTEVSEEKNTTTKIEKDNRGYTLVEKKTKRIISLITPRLYESLVLVSTKTNKSMNSLVHEILEKQKIDYKVTPEAQFISTPESSFSKKIPTVGSNYKLVPNETRSKKLNLIMQPSLHNNLAKVAKNKGISFNELVNLSLEAFIENNEN